MTIKSIHRLYNKTTPKKAREFRIKYCLEFKGKVKIKGASPLLAYEEILKTHSLQELADMALDQRNATIKIVRVDEIKKGKKKGRDST